MAGVSISTASRALSERASVRPALGARVVEAAARLSYRPNAAARGLRNAKTRTFGLLFNDLASPGQLDLFKGVGGFANETGYSLLAADAQGDHAMYLRLIGRFFEQRVEGLFLVSPSLLGESMIDYTKARIPVLALQRKDASAGAMPLVAASERRAIGEAVGCLVEAGHADIGYFFRSWDDRRVREVQDALRLKGLSPWRHSRRFSAEGGEADFQFALRAALTSTERPTALMVHSAYLRSTVDLIHDVELEIPRDISLVSVGPSSWHHLVSPRVSAVQTDSIALGRLAGRVMSEWLRGDEPPAVTSGLAVWVPQASVGPPTTR